MTTKTKTFDCVQMKREAQKRLMVEYEARESEFSSFVDFVNRPAPDEPEWIRSFRARVRKR